ncbi:energy-coupling factor transporter transmembrane protein EcfT [Cytobacillus oceanisediminis]|uniref:energy-coupling factor transporter transmembrane component T family protein n=1 Tax=Bacillaceae TaxID=186817 RepID=UPI001CC96B8A|nr:energy-coupling factor transporter transmembrane protein EcfT [Cytobacillus oceanisediminis]MBZ9535767.1 energy-coupling factor transporter transmembrane protein EcfT [Cytobacillus oceanisediminis]MDU1844570.1 energy-coupling factor transporter transmembrane protein EcfT [Niallia nealsonii]
MNKLILGRYFPGESWLHQLDARAKMISVVLLIAMLFIADNWLGYLFLWLITLFIMHLSQVPLRTYVRGVKPMIWLILFTVVLQVLFTSGSKVYVTWGPISISEYGLINGLFIFSRFVMIVFLSTVLTLTTKPIDLTDGINKLLSPLRLVKIPVDDISIMLSISLRFIPNLLDETQKVMDAQRARGTEFGDGSLFKQMKTLVPIFLPLFASSLNRAEDMANMMDVKGYNSGIKRSTFRRVYWKKQDTWCLCGVFFIGVVTVLLRG